VSEELGGVFVVGATPAAPVAEAADEGVAADALAGAVVAAVVVLVDGQLGAHVGFGNVRVMNA
jgi:hypothetical protein